MDVKNQIKQTNKTKQDGRADGLYASLSSFAGIKTTCTPMKQHYVYIQSPYPYSVREGLCYRCKIHRGGLCSRCKIYMGGGDYVHSAKFKGDYVHLYKNEHGGGGVQGILPYTLLSKQHQSTVDT